MLVVETFGMRVLRHWLEGPKAGTTDVRGQGCWATVGFFGWWRVHTPAARLCMLQAWLLQHACMLEPYLPSCPPGSVGRRRCTAQPCSASELSQSVNLQSFNAIGVP